MLSQELKVLPASNAGTMFAVYNARNNAGNSPVMHIILLHLSRSSFHPASNAGTMFAVYSAQQNAGHSPVIHIVLLHLSRSSFHPASLPWRHRRELKTSHTTYVGEHKF